jgi:predicted Zn-dependent peptidase
VAALRRRTGQVNLAVGFRALPREHPDLEALEVANHVLGGGLTSRLFEEVRERRGLAYAVYSSTAAYADAGSLVVYTGTGPDHVDEVLAVVAREVASIAAGGVSAEELDVAVGSLVGAFVLGLEDPGSRMARLGGSLSLRGTVRSVDEQVARYRAVDAAAVARVAGAVLAGPRCIASVGPWGRASLQRWAS